MIDTVAIPNTFKADLVIVNVKYVVNVTIYPASGQPY